MQTNIGTKPELPAPIAAYFVHQQTEAAALAHCFTEDGRVFDEGGEHHGRAAIAAWNAAAHRAYAFTTEPLSATKEDATTVVHARVTGSFPGGSVALQFRFTLRGELIEQLEIAP